MNDLVREAYKLLNNLFWQYMKNQLISKAEQAKNYLIKEKAIRNNVELITEKQTIVSLIEEIVNYPERFIRSEEEGKGGNYGNR